MWRKLGREFGLVFIDKLFYKLYVPRTDAGARPGTSLENSPLVLSSQFGCRASICEKRLTALRAAEQITVIAPPLPVRSPSSTEKQCL